jgi:hypothetical protein
LQNSIPNSAIKEIHSVALEETLSDILHSTFSSYVLVSCATKKRADGFSVKGEEI